MIKRFAHTLHKVILFMCIPCMVFTLTTAYGEDTQTADTGLLEAVGIIEPGSVSDIHKPLTRGEMIPLVLKCCNILFYNTDKGQVLGVQPDSKSYAAVICAYENGIIHGNEQGLFMPDKIATLDEMLSALINGIGYGERADQLGGFPSGNHAVAAQLKLLNGIDKDGSEQLEVLDFIIIANNLLQATTESFVSDGGNIRRIKSENFLKNTFGIEKAEGRINENERTNLLLSDGAGKNRIRIDDELFEIQDRDYGRFLGYTVDYYYKEDNSGKTLVYLQPSLKNKVLELVYDDIDRYESGNLYLDSKKKAKIDNNASIIFNGKFNRDYSVKDGDFISENMNLKLLDSDGNGSYDTVFANVYADLRIRSVDVNNQTIYDWYNRVVLNISDCDTVMIKGSEKTQLGNLKAGDIITVFSDCMNPENLSIDAENMSVCDIYVSRDAVTGTVESKDIYTITVAGKEYKLSKSLELLGVADSAAVKPGSRVKMYLNVFGEVAVIETETSAKDNYGFLIDASIEEPNVLIVKFLAADGIVYKAGITDKIQINNDKISSQKFFDCSSVYNKAEGHAVRQVIKYSVNREGKICKIQTAISKEGDNTYVGYTKDSFTKDASYTNAFYVNSSLMNQRYIFTDNTVCFAVPSDLYSESNEDRDYRVALKSGITNELEYNVDIFDANEDSTVNCALFHSKNYIGSLVGKGTIAVVDSITETVDEENNFCHGLIAYIKGKKQRLITDGEELTDNSTGKRRYNGDTPIDFKNLKRGDIIQYTLDAKGRIRAFRCIFQAEYKDKTPYFNTYSGEMKDVGNSQRNNHQTVNISYGEVINVLPDGMYFNTKSADDHSADMFIKFNGVTCTKISIKNNKVYSSSYGEVNIGDKVLIRRDRSILKDIIIID